MIRCSMNGKKPKFPHRIKSNMAILDVKSGRHSLSKYLSDPDRSVAGVPVFIHGEIVEQFSADDGESVEFVVNIDRVIIRSGKMRRTKKKEGQHGKKT